MLLFRLLYIWLGHYHVSKLVKINTENFNNSIQRVNLPAVDISLSRLTRYLLLDYDFETLTGT